MVNLGNTPNLSAAHSTNPQDFYVNPTFSRIQELFNQNDPTNYVWGNFYKFLNGNSYKAVAQLLTTPGWTTAQERALLAMTQGVRIDDWLGADTNKQHWLLLSNAKIQHNTSMDGTKQALTDFRFKTLASCWNECSAQMKSIIWNHWGNGASRGDELCHAFMQGCMTMWTPRVPADIEKKIQSLVGTFDAIVGNGPGNYSERSDKQIEDYSAMLHSEIKNLNNCASFSMGSVHTWRQLQGYPDFLETLGSPHPWMQALCVAYTSAMIPSMPDAIVFRKQYYGRTTAIKKPWPLQDNPSNPEDKMLAQALWQHFSNKPVTPDRSIQDLYYLLEGIESGNMVSTLFNMGSAHIEETMAVDASLFDYQP